MKNGKKEYFNPTDVHINISLIESFSNNTTRSYEQFVGENGNCGPCAYNKYFAAWQNSFTNYAQTDTHTKCFPHFSHFEWMSTVDS